MENIPSHSLEGRRDEITLQTLASRLTQYDIHEARSIVRVLLEDSFSLSYTDILTGGIDTLSHADIERLKSMMERLANGEPVQYVTGKALFSGRTFHVEPGVLIPRPETEELCDWITQDGLHGDILDIGTGSGCIAITLFLNATKETDVIEQKINVSAWDISPRALDIASKNAETLHADVSFYLRDALNAPHEDVNKWDIIVSNPPYICNQEKRDMEHNVLDYEPACALFVSDNDPLLFYRSIAKYAKHALRQNGKLYFEINPLYAKEMHHLLQEMNYSDIEIREDAFGMKRMIRANF